GQVTEERMRGQRAGSFAEQIEGSPQRLGFGAIVETGLWEKYIRHLDAGGHFPRLEDLTLGHWCKEGPNQPGRAGGKTLHGTADGASDMVADLAERPVPYRRVSSQKTVHVGHHFVQSRETQLTSLGHGHSSDGKSRLAGLGRSPGRPRV